MASWPYVLGGALLLVPLAAAAKGSTEGPKTTSAKQAALRRAIVASGTYDDGWMRFFELTAQRESNFSATAWNKSSGEKKASADLGDRVGTVGGVNFASSSWAFGSKGLFQFLGAVVAVGSNGLKFPKSMTHPDMGFDPGVATARAFEFARGLMNWSSYRGTWASLAVGWGNPSKMDDAAKIKASAKSIEDRAAKLGWARGWSDEAPPKLPTRDATQMKVFAEAAKAAYYA
jgi:hypothetical protein